MNPITYIFLKEETVSELRDNNHLRTIKKLQIVRPLKEVWIGCSEFRIVLIDLQIYVFMYGYVFMAMYGRLFMAVFVWLYMHACMYGYSCTAMYAWLYTYMAMYLWLCMHCYVFMIMYGYVWLCMAMYPWLCIYRCMYEIKGVKRKQIFTSCS